jgi:hypothetical protein
LRSALVEASHDGIFAQARKHSGVHGRS